MADFCDQLDNWFNDIASKSLLNIQQKATITGAGAAVFAKKLKDNTPYNPDINTDKHLRDCITYKAGRTIDGKDSGNTDVGFTKNKAYIARFLNDGTKKMAPTYFRDHTVEQVKADVFAAEAVAYKALLAGKKINEKGDK